MGKYILDNYSSITEDLKRVYIRDGIKIRNKALRNEAKKLGVKNFGKFYNFGYMGLYNGEQAIDIAKRKGLSKGENILDYMGSEELIINLFRIVLTEAKLKKEKNKKETVAYLIHYKVGLAIRITIQNIDAVMPEDLPVPNKSVKEIKKKIQSY